MPVILAAIHGILTSQTDPSWPDKLDAWMLRRDPSVKVLKKEYAAGPFPLWNCWVKDPRLARGLANELELFFPQPSTLNSQPSLWFVAHSNGAVIALLAAKCLIARGHKISGLILTGAACEADLRKNGILQWWTAGVLRKAIAYCSAQDEVLDGDPAHSTINYQRWPTRPALNCFRQWLWGKIMWPYGCLGHTGWVFDNKPLSTLDGGRPPGLFTRWFPGGHSGYFSANNLEATFEQIYQDVNS